MKFWMDPVCAGCGGALCKSEKLMAAMPCYTSQNGKYANQHPDKMQLRPRKGRKGIDPTMQVYHFECWPGLKNA